VGPVGPKSLAQPTVAHRGPDHHPDIPWSVTLISQRRPPDPASGRY
jgi:hypothetical protein